MTIAANLPYGIASQLLVRWLETVPWPPWFDRMMLMFQREVADRIGPPRGRGVRPPSVLAQWRTRAKTVMTLPPSVHTGTESCVRRRRVHPFNAGPCRVATLARVTAAAFDNAEDAAFEPRYQQNAGALLREAGIAPERRAEELTIAEFAKLASIVDRGDQTAA